MKFVYEFQETQKTSSRLKILPSNEFKPLTIQIDTNESLDQRGELL